MSHAPSYWINPAKTVCAMSLLLLCTRQLHAAESEEELSPTISSFSAECGDVKVRYDSKKAWNLNLIEYKGRALCIDKPGAHYGTVFNFENVGFIGSGHVENETEQVNKFSIWVDGKSVTFDSLEEGQLLKAKSEFKTQRVSTVRDFEITDLTLIKDNQIQETVTIEAKKQSALHFVYNFMSPWTPQMTNYYAVGLDDTVYSGKFVTDNKFKIQKDIKWAAWYSSKYNVGALMVITEASRNLGRKWFFIWDKGVYKKGYFRCLNRSTIPAGHKATYSLTRAFYQAPPSDWQKTAAKEAEEIIKGTNK